jgi:hypothetical protein
MNSLGVLQTVVYSQPHVITTGIDTETIPPLSMDTELNWYMSDGTYCHSSRSTFYVVA